jgi:hypothetical protein
LVIQEIIIRFFIWQIPLSNTVLLIDGIPIAASTIATTALPSSERAPNPLPGGGTRKGIRSQNLPQPDIESVRGNEETYCFTPHRG